MDPGKQNVKAVCPKDKLVFQIGSVHRSDRICKELIVFRLTREMELYIEVSYAQYNQSSQKAQRSKTALSWNRFY